MFSVKYQAEDSRLQLFLTLLLDLKTVHLLLYAFMEIQGVGRLQ